jgi:hypothetical protein
MPIANVGNGILMVLKPGISINFLLTPARQNGRTSDDTAETIQWTSAEGTTTNIYEWLRTRGTPGPIGDYEYSLLYKLSKCNGANYGLST